MSRKPSSTTGDVFSPTISDQVDVGTAKILTSPHVSQGPGRIANAPIPSVFSDDRGDIHRLRVGHVAHHGSPSTDTGAATLSSRGTRINLLYSKGGIMRSGYLHPIPKRDYVLRGQVEVWILTPTCTEKRIYNSNETFEIDAYTPHILHFLQDTVLIEWWWWPEDENAAKNDKSSAISTEPEKEDATKMHRRRQSRAESTTGGDLPCWYYHPYRRIVDVHNSLIAPSTGRFQRLVPQDSNGDKRFGYGDDDEDDDDNRGGFRFGFLRSMMWWTSGFVAGAVVMTAFGIVALGEKPSSSTPSSSSSRP